MQNYKGLKVWASAHELTVGVYKETGSFPREELYGLTSQVRRAAASIPTNIAEGCGRNSNNDFAHYLNIALGSANETEYLLTLSKDLGFMNEESAAPLLKTINEIKAMLLSLIKKVRGK